MLAEFAMESASSDSEFDHRLNTHCVFNLWINSFSGPCCEENQVINFLHLNCKIRICAASVMRLWRSEENVIENMQDKPCVYILVVIIIPPRTCISHYKWFWKVGNYACAYVKESVHRTLSLVYHLMPSIWALICSGHFICCHRLKTDGPISWFVCNTNLVLL